MKAGKNGSRRKAHQARPLTEAWNQSENMANTTVAVASRYTTRPQGGGEAQQLREDHADTTGSLEDSGDQSANAKYTVPADQQGDDEGQAQPGDMSRYHRCPPQPHVQPVVPHPQPLSHGAVLYIRPHAAD
ncbi:hypothetical protein INR49_031928 [Caranx melampygus]|nr:hypothetical protein INR49_031928 [Caranx melampygus]